MQLYLNGAFWRITYSKKLKRDAQTLLNFYYLWTLITVPTTIGIIIYYRIFEYNIFLPQQLALLY